MPKNKKSDLESIKEIEKKSCRIKSAFEEIGKGISKAGSDFEKIGSGFEEMRGENEVIRSRIKEMRRDAGRAGLDFKEIISHTGMARFDFKSAEKNAGIVRANLHEIKEMTDMEVNRLMEFAKFSDSVRSDVEKGEDVGMREDVFAVVEQIADKLRVDYNKIWSGFREINAAIKMGRSNYNEIEREVEMASAACKRMREMSHKITKKPSPLGTARSDQVEMEKWVDLAIPKLRELEKSAGAIRSGLMEMEGYAYKIRSKFGEIEKEVGTIRSDLLNRAQTSASGNGG